jgi:hypothetical protein
VRFTPEATASDATRSPRELGVEIEVARDAVSTASEVMIGWTTMRAVPSN